MTSPRAGDHSVVCLPYVTREYMREAAFTAPFAPHLQAREDSSLVFTRRVHAGTLCGIWLNRQ